MLFYKPSSLAGGFDQSSKGCLLSRGFHLFIVNKTLRTWLCLFFCVVFCRPKNTGGREPRTVPTNGLQSPREAIMIDRHAQLTEGETTTCARAHTHVCVKGAVYIRLALVALGKRRAET